MFNLSTFQSFGGYFLIGFLTLLSAIFVILKNPKPRLNRLYASLNICMAIFFIGTFMINTHLWSKNLSLNLFKMFYLFAIFIPVIALNLSYSMHQNPDKNITKIFSFFKDILYPLTILVICGLPTKFFINDLIVSDLEITTIFKIKYSYFYYLFLANFTIGLAGTIILFLKGIFETTKNKKNQFLLVFSGYVIAILGASIFPINYLFNSPISNQLPFYAIISGFLIVFFSISKFRFLEIDLAWRYAFEYAFYTIITTALFFYLGVFLLNNTSGLHGLTLLVAISAFSIPFIRRKFALISCHLLSRKYNAIFKKLNNMIFAKNKTFEILDFAYILVEDLAKTMNIEKSIYYKLNERTNKYIPILANHTKEYLPINNMILEHLQKTKEYIYIEYLNNEKNELKTIMQQNNISLVLPLFYDNLMIGVIIYGDKKNDKIFHLEEIKIIKNIILNIQEKITDFIYIHYSNSHEIETISKKYKHTYNMQLLKEAKKMDAMKTIEEITNYTEQLFAKNINTEFTSFYLFDNTLNNYKLFNQKQTLKQQLPENISENGDLIKYLRENNSIFVYDKLTEQKDLLNSFQFDDPNLKSILIIPIFHFTLLGFFILGEKKEITNFYTSDDFFVLSLIADRFEINLKNILEKDKAKKDILTGLYNKSYFEHSLLEHITHTLKKTDFISVMIIDIDDFKYFNHYSGYETGDKVLTAVVASIKNTLNENSNNEIYRYKNDEIAIICSNTDEHSTIILAKKIIKNISKDTEIKNISEHSGKNINVSIGISCFKSNKVISNFSNEDINNTSFALINRAELALLKAQENNNQNYCISKPFELDTEETNKESVSNIFPTRVLFVSDSLEYSELASENIYINTIFRLDDAVKICDCYDVIIVELLYEDLEVFAKLNDFKKINKNVRLAVITEHIEYKTMINDFGAKFFSSPIYLEDIKKWINNIRDGNNKSDNIKNESEKIIIDFKTKNIDNKTSNETFLANNANSFYTKIDENKKSEKH